MKLYLVHTGFYHEVAGGGIYELHTNLFVAARSFDDARARAKALPEFKAKKMHIDGMQEIEQVDGYRVELARPARGARAARGARGVRGKPAAGAEAAAAASATIVHNKRSFYA